MIPILVFEPHADDAYLSVGHHIEKVWREAGHPVYINTVFQREPKRLEEAWAFAEAAGAEYLLGDQLWAASAYANLPLALAAFLKGLDPMLIVGPVGVQHEEHIALADALREVAKRDRRHKFLSYLDLPYSAKAKNQAEVAERIGVQPHLASIAYPPAAKKRHARLFKSQSKFFYFNPPEKLAKLPEIILGGTS